MGQGRAAFVHSRVAQTVQNPPKPVHDTSYLVDKPVDKKWPKTNPLKWLHLGSDQG